MQIAKIILLIAQLLGTSSPILVALDEKAVYRDGKPTEEKYTAVTVTSAESGFEKLTVKLATRPPFTFTNDEITAKNIAGDYIRVTFDGDSCRMWTDKAGNVQISATAKSVRIVNNGDDEVLDV